MANEHSQYAPAAHVPLIKSPSLRVPRPVELPPDIHPLPESVAAYFVYPFTLEPHITTLESSRRTTLAAHTARREAYLKTRDEERERRRRDALRRVAPGFEMMGAVLTPTKTGTNGITASMPTEGQVAQGHTRTHSRGVMEDLVDQLAALDSNSSR